MPTLPKSWPSIARDILLDAVRLYYRDMKEPWPVPDVIMERAIAWANEELTKRQSAIYEEASSTWIDRWESGALDAEMERAIEETYRQLNRDEGPIRGPRASARKKTSRQLDAEISQALAVRRR